MITSFPSTAYGYVEQGATSGDGSFGVARFIEKPNADDAKSLVLKRNEAQCALECSIFLAQASTLLEAVRQHAGDIFQSREQAMEKAKQDQQFVLSTKHSPPAALIASTMPFWSVTKKWRWCHLSARGATLAAGMPWQT